jgi:hypothetical protein
MTTKHTNADITTDGNRQAAKLLPLQELELLRAACDSILSYVSATLGEAFDELNTNTRPSLVTFQVGRLTGEHSNLRKQVELLTRERDEARRERDNRLVRFMMLAVGKDDNTLIPVAEIRKAILEPFDTSKDKEPGE